MRSHDCRVEAVASADSLGDGAAAGPDQIGQIPLVAGRGLFRDNDRDW
jgi:hypothetical protein